MISYPKVLVSIIVETVGSCFRFLFCRKSNEPQAPRAGRPVVLRQNGGRWARQLPCLGCLLFCCCSAWAAGRPPVVVARRRLLDGVIERRTQHASRPQTAAPAAQHPSSPDARGRGSRRNPGKVRYCSLEPRGCDGRRDAHERRAADRPPRLMKRRKTRARTARTARAKKMCVHLFSE